MPVDELAGLCRVIAPSSSLLVFLPQDHLANLLTHPLIGQPQHFLSADWLIAHVSLMLDKCFPLRMSTPHLGYLVSGPAGGWGRGWCTALTGGR